MSVSSNQPVGKLTVVEDPQPVGALTVVDEAQPVGKLTPVEEQPAPFNNFESALAEVENAQKVGFKDGMWKPHASPEGGTDTIGYGHKLTKAEAASGKYDDGISDSDAIALYRKDIESHKDIVRKDVKDFDELPPKYQDVLVNIAYNTGNVKENKWPSLLKGMRAGDDAVVRKEMVTSFTDEEGNKGLLKTRAKKIADAVGLGGE